MMQAPDYRYPTHLIIPFTRVYCKKRAKPISREEKI